MVLSFDSAWNRLNGMNMTNWPLEYRLLLCFVFSLFVGGFLNLAIYRLARNSRGISPWSSPPTGLPPRTFWDRIPVLGWLRLRRESHYWGVRFWIRPMLLELCFAIGVIVLYLYEVDTEGLLLKGFLGEGVAQNPWNPPLFTEVIHRLFATHFLLLCLLVVVTFIDIDEKTIPDDVTLPGTLLGLLLVTLNPWILPNIATLRVGDQMYVDFVHFLSPSAYPAGDPTIRELSLALGCLWLWVVALLPRSWHGRYGFRRAWKYFWVALFCGRCGRQTMVLLSVGSVLTLGILYVWSLGGTPWVGLLSSLAGMACGTALIWSIRLVGRATLKREAMGFGDVTLMAMIGSFIGWQATLVVFFLAPLAGLVVGLIQFVMHREDEVPYGPFLCLATLVTLLSWPSLWNYLAPIFASLGSALPVLLLFCLGLMALLLAVWARIKKNFYQPANKV